MTTVAMHETSWKRILDEHLPNVEAEYALYQKVMDAIDRTAAGLNNVPDPIVEVMLDRYERDVLKLP